MKMKAFFKTQIGFTIGFIICIAYGIDLETVLAAYFLLNLGYILRMIQERN
jgi:hypothetical protein